MQSGDAGSCRANSYLSFARPGGTDGGRSMHPLIPCPRCGQTIRVPVDMAGKRVRCRKCDQEFLAPDRLDSAEASPPKPHPSPAPGGYNETLSRSMLPWVGVGTATEEMICRLAPQTLLWIDATDA